MNEHPSRSRASVLRQRLHSTGFFQVPSCFDALSDRLVEQAGFEAVFMSGFSTSAAQLGLPDTGYISYSEMLENARNICAATSIPVIADGDTGYGNALNMKRTVRGYAQIGVACIMIEDQVIYLHVLYLLQILTAQRNQVAPKRCGHTNGKSVVPREEALQRVRAAVDARNEGADILILARTDARSCLGLEEALDRVKLFEAAGADIGNRKFAP